MAFSRDSVEIASISWSVVCRYTDGAVAASRFGQERGACRCTMRRRCSGGSSTTMRRRETLRWRWRPNRTTVRWRRTAQMLGPLLGRVAIHSWRQGGTAWSLLVPREKPTAGCVDVGQVEEVSAGGRTRGVIGLGGCARKHRAGRVRGSLQNRTRTRFRQFSKNCPRKIPEGRVATSRGLRRVEANFSELSRPSDVFDVSFPVLPLRAFSLISAVGVF